LLAGLAVAVAVAACGNLKEDAAAPASSALTGPVPTVGQFVLLASHGASLDDRTVVSGGDLGVAASTTGGLDALTAGYDARVGIGEVLLAQKVVLKDRTIAGEIGATVIVAPRAKTGPRSAFVAPPAPPTPGSFTAGTAAVTVARGQTQTLPPGKYGAVNVDGTLLLAGGLYEVAGLRLGHDAHVVALASSTVRIVGGLAAADRATMAPAAPLRAGDLRVVVAGTLDGSTSISWGHDGRLTALFIAGGKFKAEDRLVASGAIAARDVMLESDSRLTFDGGFECSSSAGCDDGDACTVDTCVDALCTHAPVPMCPATQADLALTKTVSDATPEVGDVITYTVTLTNNGPGAATSVEVTDLLPPGLTFVTATPSQGTYSSMTGVWTIGSVAAGSPQTLQLQARVVSPSPQTNTATVTHVDQPDPDPANNTATATETPQQADLALTKTVGNATANVGDTITYVLTLSNNGPGAATNVQVTDLLPPGLTFVSATPSQGSYDSSMGLWTVGTIAAGTSQTLGLQAQVVSPNAETNTATISRSDQFDPNTANNSASATETPQQADLALTKTVDNPAPFVGDAVTYTITLSNNGPDAATNVLLSDVLPAGLTFQSSTPSQGTYDSSTGVWTVGTVTGGGSQTLLLVARVASPDPQTNTVTIAHADQFDPSTTNNVASATETPQQQSDLSVAKTVDNARPNVGDLATFTVTATNNGPSPATNVTVSDLLPAGLTFVSATTSQGTYDSGTGVWTVGTVASGTSQTLAITARVVSPNAQTNTATVTHVDQPDPDPANDTASATETPQLADLALTKTVSNATANVGDTIAFTLTLSDNGPDAATNVTVNDLLPAGLFFESATPSQGTYSSGSGVWVVGTVAPGTSQTLVITAQVASPNVETNSAGVSHSDQFDPNTANNAANATESPQQADLALAKTVDNPTASVGDPVTYLVTLTNLGPDAATNVQVTDLLPSGLSFQSATVSQGTYSSSTGFWNVGTVTAGGSQTLQIVALVVSTSPQTNTASITHADQFDPNTANNTASATESPQQMADLALSKTVANPFPNVGDAITFTVTLSNNGPGDATNVQVTDQLPAGLGFLSASPSQGSFNSATGVWMVGTVVSGASQSMILVARVVSPAPQTNTATISAADQIDPDPTNNTAGVTVTPQQADLVLTKRVDNPTPAVGGTVTFTVTVTDNGPRQATNVQVTDLLPAGLTFVSATASQGSYSSASGLWFVGSVAAGTTKTLQVVASVASPDAQTNTASIAHADQFDPNTSNNSASATVTPQ
jgi:uncharacterized repeat protein (TIGR01451 family)